MRSEWILVVEDDAQIRNFITYTLKQEGFPCLTAGNAQGALSQLVSNQVDLMLLDLGLPDFDGMEVIKKVREWSEVPIIVVSARDQDNEKAAELPGRRNRPNTAWADCPSIWNRIWYFWTGRSCTSRPWNIVCCHCCFGIWERC